MDFRRLIMHAAKAATAPALALSLLLCTGIRINAQDNPYGIDNECYDLFVKAQAESSDDSGLKYSEQLLSLARTKNDRKAATLAYVTRLRQFFSLDRYDDFFSTCEDLKRVASENGFDQYYYYAYTEEISYYLKRGETVQALNAARQAYENAEEAGNDYGLMTAARSVGDVYSHRGDINGARRFYRISAEYADRITGQTSSNTWVALADTYSEMDSILFYLDKARDRMIAPGDSVLVYKHYALAYGKALDRQSYNTARSEFSRYLDKYRTGATTDELTLLETYDAIFAGNLQKAAEIASSIQGTNTRNTVLRDIALRRGDYKAAYDALTNLEMYRDSMSVSLTYADVADFEEFYAQEQIKAERNLLKLESEKTILKQRSRLYLVIFGSAAILLFVLVNFFIFYIREKNASINRQKTLSRNLMESMDDARQAKDEAIRMKEAALLAKEEAILSREEAVKANNMKTSFVQNMSHEIRTPLNAIVGFSQLMSLPDGFLSIEEKQQYSKYILSNSNLLTMLIDDILNINDVESGNYKISIEQTPCNQICRDAMNSVEYRVPPGVEYSFSTDIDDSFMISTDERRVRQVIINFLTNACKHTEKGHIKVNCSLSDDGSMVEFSVCDTGTGVPPDMTEVIFERFAKLNSFKQGAGLGLHICKIIAEKLGGTIGVDTTYTEGARFYFCIPTDRKNIVPLTCEQVS